MLSFWLDQPTVFPPMTLIPKVKRWQAAAALAVWLSIGGLRVTSFAQTTTLSVTNFGARGDALQILANTVSNSALVTVSPANPLSSADAGKLILLFGVGAGAAGTNHQDLVAQILGVANGTNIAISVPAGLTANQIPCTYGTQNAQAFQSCVDACTGTNATVLIPPGRYLLVSSSVLDPSFVMPNPDQSRAAITLNKGGIHFLGADPASSVLLGNGAWLLKTAYVQRGWMFICQGPITNDYPLVFENLTMDGGVQQGRTAFDNSGPALTADGSGWDVTHDAVVDAGQPPLHAVKRFLN